MRLLRVRRADSVLFLNMQKLVTAEFIEGEVAGKASTSRMHLIFSGREHPVVISGRAADQLECLLQRLVEKNGLEPRVIAED